MKTILLTLKIEDEGFSEEELIQNILCSIPNRITVSMKEIIETKTKEQIEYENGKPEEYT